MSIPLVLASLRGIDQARLKVGWAKHHLDVLNVEIALYLKAGAYQILPEDDLDRGEYIIKFEIFPLPVHIPLILGDFVSALRASLDHLAGELTRVPTGTSNAKASFPIIGVDDEEGKSLLRKSTRGIAPLAIPAIKSLQPYQSGDAYQSTKLWRLNRLWNIDKHRRIPHRETSIKFSLSHPKNASPISDTRHKNGGEVRFRLADKPYVKLEPTVQIGIQFGDESEGVLVDATELFGIYEYVGKEAFPLFENFF